MASADEGDFENVGQGNGKVEIALAEAALIEIGVDRAKRVAFVGERDAERVGVMTETVGLRAAAAAWRSTRRGAGGRRVR